MKIATDSLAACAMALKLAHDRVKVEAQAAEAMGRTDMAKTLQAEMRALDEGKNAMLQEVRAPSGPEQQKNYLFNREMMEALVAGKRVELGGGFGLVMDPSLLAAPVDPRATAA